ncbi:MAG TPA: hypothetical protein DCM87_14495, partial [Planctomycetes bacterium]|nr:hypothetical protein [Planctomycetota bacterium]
FDIIGERGVEPDLVYVRVGDTNGDAKIDIADAISLLGYLFGGGVKPPPGCKKSADANDDGKLDIADAIKILGYLFAQQTLILPDGTVVNAGTYPGCVGFLPEDVNDPGTGCLEPCGP